LASWLVQAGVSLFKVQQLLGHTTPMVTQKYAKLAQGAVADEAAEILDQLAVERAA
jgi:site-specific recombinase XerD